MLTNTAVQLPGAGVQPLGGGPVLQKPKPLLPADPLNSMDMMGDRSAGPSIPDPPQMMQATGMNPAVQPPEMPMPKPQPQQAKPSTGGPMPAMNAPEINAPQNPGYFPMQPGVREIQAPSISLGRAATPPTFTGAPEYSAKNISAPTVQASQAPSFQAQQGSVGQIQSNFAPGQFSAPQITASYDAQNVSAPNLPGYNAQSVNAPSLPSYSPQGASPVAFQQAGVGQMGPLDTSALSNFSQFTDAVMSEQRRLLDPMFQEQEAAFRQRMVNQGIQEGTDAFDKAYANFSRSRNDAYSSARNQALAQALGAQQQAFGQGFSNRQLDANLSMANSQNSLQAALQAQQLSQADRQFGANLGLQQAGLGLDAARINQADRQFGANLGLQGAQLGLDAARINQSDRQFGANLGMAAQQQNAANALQAAGMGQADNQFAANLGMQAQGQNASNALQLLGMNQADRQFGANLGLQNAQLSQQASLANAANALQAAGMNQADRQFGSNQQTRLAELANAFAMQGAQLGEGQRQFDANMGLRGAELGQQAQAQNASNQLQAAGLGQADRQFGANMGLQYGQMGLQAQLANAANFINQNQFGRNLGFQYAGLGENARQFDANLGFQGQRADMSDLMALLGYGQSVDQYNNALLGQDQQRAGALFGLIPGLTPTQLDVTGPMNSYLQAQQAAYNRQGSAANGMFGALGQLGGAAINAGGFGGLFSFSDARLKTDISRVGTLDNGLPVYRYRYKAGGPMQIGVMAQDVQQVRPGAVAEIDGFLAVNYAEATA